MLGDTYDGRLFEFENTFFNDPVKMGFIKLWQIGEMSTEPGYAMAEHSQLCHEISYIVSGKGVFHTNKTAMPVSQGDIHIIPKGGLHAIESDRAQGLRFAYIGFEFIHSGEDNVDSLIRAFENPPAHIIRDMGEVRLLIYMLINEMYSKPVYNSIMVECYSKQILVQIYRLFASAETGVFVPDGSKNMTGQSVYSIVRYIDNHIYEIRSIQEIAKEMGYSHSYLSHLFKVKMGVTMQSYIAAKKIEASLDLLKYRKSSIGQIANILGYESSQSFGKVFKRRMGVTPTEYQKKYSQEEED